MLGPVRVEPKMLYESYVPLCTVSPIQYASIDNAIYSHHVDSVFLVDNGFAESASCQINTSSYSTPITRRCSDAVGDLQVHDFDPKCKLVKSEINPMSMPLELSCSLTLHSDINSVACLETVNISASFITAWLSYFMDKTLCMPVNILRVVRPCFIDRLLPDDSFRGQSFISTAQNYIFDPGIEH